MKVLSHVLVAVSAIVATVVFIGRSPTKRPSVGEAQELPLLSSANLNQLDSRKNPSIPLQSDLDGGDFVNVKKDALLRFVRKRGMNRHLDLNLPYLSLFDLSSQQRSNVKMAILATIDVLIEHEKEMSSLVVDEDGSEYIEIQPIEASEEVAKQLRSQIRNIIGAEAADVAWADLNLARELSAFGKDKRQIAILDSDNGPYLTESSFRPSGKRKESWSMSLQPGSLQVQRYSHLFETNTNK